jgi:hypothetical protein
MYTRPMGPLLVGFGDEIEKLAKDDEFAKQRRALARDLRKVTRVKGSPKVESLRGKSSPRQRDYVASAAIGAAAYPAIVVLQQLARRKFGNRALSKAMATASKKDRKRLKSRMDVSPLVGSITAKKRPRISKQDLAAVSVRGGAMGSLLQMVRDRYAGSTPA